MTTILAKRARNPACPTDGEGLPGHTAAVAEMAELLLSALGGAVADAFGWDDRQAGRFARMLRTAAVLHDLGKANGQFQGYLRGEVARQSIRHEQVSYWLAKQALERLGFDAADRRMIAWSVLGHHRQYPDPAERGGGGPELALHTRHPDFLRAYARLSGGGADFLPDSVGMVGRGSLPMELRIDENDAAAEHDRWPTPEKTLLAALKASLICADVLGSAAARGRGDLRSWADAAWRNNCTAEGCRAIAERRLDGQPPRRFQRELGESSARLTLALAGCGSGKTVGAYLWAARHAAGRKLLFCYPTTGTATEGFRDYLREADATLSHSRSAIDFELLDMDDPLEEAEDRLNAARAICEWHPQVTDCTADLVLGIVHNARSSVYAWPTLVNGAFVFDEVHAYDETLWRSLLVFLRTFRAPCLLMTASLPEARRMALEALAAESDEAISVVAGPAELERMPRYRQERADARQSAADVLARGGKVLWVGNTVDRCLAAAGGMADLSPLVYHSRFRYVDRVARHRELIAAFRASGPALAVCTQVAEMSLDISADLLVTDLAPVPALIQRLGRLNRRASPQAPSPPAPFILVDPDGALPYDAAELAGAGRWVRALGDGPLSQADLARLWEPEPETVDTLFRCEWLEGGMQTRPGPTRAGSPSISVLLPGDADAARQDPGQLSALVVPIPPPRFVRWNDWPTVGYARIAPPGSIDYDPQRGARWRR